VLGAIVQPRRRASAAITRGRRTRLQYPVASSSASSRAPRVPGATCSTGLAPLFGHRRGRKRGARRRAAGSGKCDHLEE